MTRTTTLALSAAALAGLGLPATAAAHPSAFEVTARIVKDKSRPNELTDQQQYVIANHGYPWVLRETNGMTSRGVVNYKRLPGDYRNQPGFTPERMIDEGATGAQPHATCDVASLGTDAVLEWQKPEGAGAKLEPFYGYVPFQAKGAGLDDDPADWIAVVRSRTGVDLARTTDFKAACQGIGGTYVPADEVQTQPESLASGTIAKAVDAATSPLKAQIDALTTARAAAENIAAGAQNALDELRRATTVTVGSATLSGSKATAVVTGPAGKRVVVRLMAGTTVLGTSTRTIPPGGKLRLSVWASRKALQKQRGGLTVDAALAPVATTAVTR